MAFKIVRQAQSNMAAHPTGIAINTRLLA